MKEYIERVKKYTKEFNEFKKSNNNIVILRLMTFLIGILTVVYCYFKNIKMVGIVLGVISLFIFIYLIKKHNDIKFKLKYLKALILINEKGIKRTEGKWKEFEERGEEFIEETHPYCSDLDLFGKGSLYQYINSTTTYTGRNTLANYFKYPLKSKEEIINRQETIKELASKLQFRQDFNAVGLTEENVNKDFSSNINFAKDVNKKYLNKKLSIIINVLPTITIVLFLLSIFIKQVPTSLSGVLVAIQIAMLLVNQAEREETLNSIFTYKKSIYSYLKMLQLIENEEFKSKSLNDMKENSKTNNVYPSKVLKILSDITYSVGDRANMYYIILNILLLYDYRLMIKIQRWKSRYGSDLEKYITLIGEVEALSSISNLAYENSDYVYPSIDNSGYIAKGEEVGHELIGKNAVTNPINIKNKGDVTLITGSNMSGKSTYLRTIGINLLLSYIGAPVKAKSFSCKITSIYTCMRVSDNLEKNISSFYAEILKIKEIVSAAKNSDDVFFLLDEIFKGTNSIDRHTGAKVLIKQLSRCSATGLISTHDLELADMEKEFPKLSNMHFQEYYEDGKLKFDHKLKEGVSTTRNALYIIKMAGIDI